MSENAVEICDLSYTYADGTHALNCLNAAIPKKKKTAILGANGCGKSTLLRHLNGLILPQKGSVSINGQSITKRNADQIRQTVGLLFDNPDNQLFSPTVEADVSFGPYNLRMKDADVKRLTEDAMKEVGIFDLREKSPYNLSLGQKKRCAIAGVLAMKPDILLMDEPFSGLDPLSLEQFLETLTVLHKHGMTQILSTHDVDIAYEWADHVIVMSNGSVLAAGDQTIMQDAELMKKAGLAVPMLVRLFAGADKIPLSFAEAQRRINTNKDK
ncbi:MAG: energy-coupling factor ABC transporter ATP-binding protein [Lachnospiraceae bacterium]